MFKNININNNNIYMNKIWLINKKKKKKTINKFIKIHYKKKK